MCKRYHIIKLAIWSIDLDINLFNKYTEFDTLMKIMILYTKTLCIFMLHLKCIIDL